MASLQKIIKVTKAQYQTLSNGGTVGSYTGLDPNYLYFVIDDNCGVININNGLTAAIKAQVQEAPNTMLYYSSYFYVPQYGESSTLPEYYSCFEGDAGTFHYLIVDWTELDFESHTEGYVNSVKTLSTNSTTALTPSSSEYITGSGSIQLHKVSKTGSYNDLLDKPTISDANYYPTAVSWTNGTSAGPTGTMTMSGTGNVSIPAIPAATQDISGIVTTSAQTFAGNKALTGSLVVNSSTTLYGNTYFGPDVPQTRGLTDAPKAISFVDFNQRASGLKQLFMFSGAGDHFYCADKQPNFIVRSTFQGYGDDRDVYKASYYVCGTDSTTLPNLFDWTYGTSWSVLPSKVSSSTPAIIEIKRSSRINYTDVLRLIMTGHGGYDSGSHWSGILNDYQIEVCTSYDNDTWVTVVNRTGVQDKIGSTMVFALQTSNYTECYGIRLKINSCSVTGSGYAFIRITSMQLRNYRPDFTVPEAVGAIGQLNGKFYGSIVMNNPNGADIYPNTTGKGLIGRSDHRWQAVHAVTFYENGTSLANTYLGKTAKAADADKLDGQDSPYYLNYNNFTNTPTLGTAAAKNSTTSVTQNSADLVTSGAVWTAIDNLPEPMVFKGTLGTGGTITSLPAASASNNGFTYKVITAGTYQSIACKVGDVVVSNGSAWTLIPAGDTDSDTWRGIKVNGTDLLGSAISTGAVNFKNGSNVTISGSGNDITISASQPTVNNATLTIQKNGTTVNTFTANASSNVTANITVPTVPTTTTANKMLVSTSTSDSPKWSDWSSAGLLKTNSSGVISVDTNSYLTSESDTLSTVLNRGNTANKDIDLNYHDFFNAGVQKTCYNYSTSQDPNTQYWWYQIVPPSGSQSDRYLICVEGDENYPRGRGTFILDVSKYSTNSYNVSLNNVGSTMWGDTHLLKCAMDSSGNVYIQANAAWSSYLRFIRHNSNSTTQAYTQIGKAAFGTANGFTSVKMITDCGTIRLYNGSIDTSSSNSGFTSVDAEKFREGGSYLADKYLGKTAKAADADKLDGNDSTYYLNYNNLSNKPTIPTVNNATLTIQKNGTTVKTFTANASTDVTANITVPTSAGTLTGTTTVNTSSHTHGVTVTPTTTNVVSGTYDSSTGILNLTTTSVLSGVTASTSASTSTTTVASNSHTHTLS